MFTAKRFARAWLALLLAIMPLLAACAKPSEGEKPKFRGAIALWASDDLAAYPGRLEAGWLAERARGFEAAHEGVTVQIRSLATGEELERALLAGGELPDLYLGRPLAALGEKRAGLALPPELVSDHQPGALAPFKQGEAVTGLPLLFESQVLALNEPLFAARSVDLPKDGRWADGEFTDRIAKLSGHEVFGLGFSIAPGYHQWWPLAAGLFGPDGSAAPGAETGLARLAQWRKSGVLYPDIARLSTEESYQRFAGGKIAVLPISAWEIPLLRGEPYKAAFTVAAFPGDANSGYVYGLTAIGSGQDEGKLAAMADLVAFLAAPDQQVRLARKSGLMPARKSAPNPFEGDPQMTRAFQLSGSFQPLPAGPAWDAAQGGIAQELLLALYGGKTPADALSAAKQQLDTATTSAR